MLTYAMLCLKFLYFLILILVHSSPSIKNFFLGFGAILFSFGGASTFPTIQNDMKDPATFPKAVIVAYIGMT